MSESCCGGAVDEEEGGVRVEPRTRNSDNILWEMTRQGVTTHG